MQFVNETAPTGSRIVVWGPVRNAEPFFRSDLKLARMPRGDTGADPGAFAAIGCNWATLDPSFFPDAPTIWSVEREGVPLAIVKLLAPSGGRP
jgi:hypothetical protein